MIRAWPLWLILFSFAASGTLRGDDSGHLGGGESFQLEIPAKFEIEDPVPEGDQWLESLLVRLGSGVRLTSRDYAIWRQTSISLNVDGETTSKCVYARSETEDRFLVIAGGLSSTSTLRPFVVSWFRYQIWDPPSHVVFYMSPSKRYIVVMAEDSSPLRATREHIGRRAAGWIVDPATMLHSEIELSSTVWEVDIGVSIDRLKVAKWKKKAVTP